MGFKYLEILGSRDVSCHGQRQPVFLDALGKLDNVESTTLWSSPFSTAAIMGLVGFHLPLSVLCFLMGLNILMYNEQSFKASYCISTLSVNVVIYMLFLPLFSCSRGSHSECHQCHVDWRALLGGYRLGLVLGIFFSAFRSSASPSSPWSFPNLDDNKLVNLYITIRYNPKYADINRLPQDQVDPSHCDGFIFLVCVWYWLEGSQWVWACERRIARAGSIFFKKNNRKRGCYKLLFIYFWIVLSKKKSSPQSRLVFWEGGKNRC